MGHEVQLAFHHDGSPELDALLRSTPHFDRYDAAYRTYEFRGPENVARGYDMPDAAVIGAKETRTDRTCPEVAELYSPS